MSGHNDYRVERLCASGWLLVLHGTQREAWAAYYAVTAQLDLIHTTFRVVRPDGAIELQTAPPSKPGTKPGTDRDRRDGANEKPE